MSEYKVSVQDITSIVNRDLPKAAKGLESQVNPLIDARWRVQGGLTTVQAGGNICLLQAMTW